MGQGRVTYRDCGIALALTIFVFVAGAVHLLTAPARAILAAKEAAIAEAAELEVQLQGQVQAQSPSEAVVSRAPAAVQRASASIAKKISPVASFAEPQTGIQKIHAIETTIGGHYAHLAAPETLRRWVSLVLADIDTDFQDDFNRIRLVNDLMKDAVGAARDVASVLEALPAGEEAERVALVRLATDIGSNNENAVPHVEVLLTREAQRTIPRGSASQGFVTDRVNLLLDSYFKLVNDPAKRVRFAEQALRAQKEPAAIDLIERRLEQLNLVASYRQGDGSTSN